MTTYEPVIGLEVHVQLKTQSKLFCSCSTEFGNKPNANTCPVCSGQPGALPVLNQKAVELAMRAGFILNCTIADRSVFSRKNYFYPDLPKGYQISQFDLPTCLSGFVEIKLDGQAKKIRVQRAHMEEDAGKLVHQGAEGIAGSTHSFVDLNRSSVPLLEIVSEPDIRSAAEAKVYLEKLKTLLQFAGVSDANMEEGKLRCDANVSIKPVGVEKLGTRTEIKNMNSFKAVEKAILGEIARQTDVLNAGGKIVQETRNYIDETGTTTSLRSKEEAHDYRYFPEPDLLPLIIDEAWKQKVKSEIPEMPEQRTARYVALGLSEYDASVLVLNKTTSDYFDAVLQKYSNAKTLANWMNVEITGWLNKNSLDFKDIKITPAQLAEMLSAVDAGTISGKMGKELIVQMLETGKSVNELLESSGKKQINDPAEIQKLIDQVVAASPNQLAQYKAGKVALFGYFVGQVMKTSQGCANPAVTNELLKKVLG